LLICTEGKIIYLSGMKAEELQIGNWLERHDGSRFQVTADDIKIIAEWKANKDLLPKGIRLNEKELLKLGL
jgi:hypothetical protein